MMLRASNFWRLFSSFSSGAWRFPFYCSECRIQACGPVDIGKGKVANRFSLFHFRFSIFHFLCLALVLSRHSLQHVSLHCFKRRGVVRKPLRPEMRFEFQEQLGAFGLARTFEGHTLLRVRRRGGRGAEIRATHPPQPRQNFPSQLVSQTPQPF
jgi:hypothetical protein